jgi:hypothetical protein
VAQSQQAEELLSEGKSEEIDESMQGMFERLAEHNEKMRQQREREQALVDQGIDPRTVYPLETVD